MNEKITILIADDHPILRQGLKQIIEREIDLEVVGEAGDGAAALSEIVSREPAIVVLDVDMPKLNGFAVLEAMREKQSAVRVILLTVHDEEEFFSEALRLGAHGYVLKDSAVEDIVKAVRAVHAGGNFISPTLSTHLFAPNKQNPRSDLANLTATEREILKLIAEYKINREIADALFISPHTVKTHRRNICVKLDLEGNHALMKYALENKTRL